MKKIIIIISVLICAFISGCNLHGKEKVQTLEKAYFYIIDNIKDKQNVEINYVTNLLKGYNVKNIDHSDTHDVEGENAYSYIFTDDNNTSLSVNFIVSDDKETIDTLEFLTGDNNINLNYYASLKEESFNLIINNLDKSIYRKIVNKKSQLGLTSENKEDKSELSDACISIINELDSGKDIKIEDIKKSLENYSFESKLTGDDESIGLKMHNYSFSNNNNEKLVVSTNVEYNEETISNISYFIGPNSELQLSFGYPLPDETITLSVSYYTNDNSNYKRLYNLIK